MLRSVEKLLSLTDILPCDNVRPSFRSYALAAGAIPYLKRYPTLKGALHMMWLSDTFCLILELQSTSFHELVKRSYLLGGFFEIEVEISSLALWRDSLFFNSTFLKISIAKRIPFMSR